MAKKRSYRASKEQLDTQKMKKLFSNVWDKFWEHNKQFWSIEFEKELQDWGDSYGATRIPVIVFKGGRGSNKWIEERYKVPLLSIQSGTTKYPSRLLVHIKKHMFLYEGIQKWWKMAKDNKKDQILFHEVVHVKAREFADELMAMISPNDMTFEFGKELNENEDNREKVIKLGLELLNGKVKPADVITATAARYVHTELPRPQVIKVGDSEDKNSRFATSKDWEKYDGQEAMTNRLKDLYKRVAGSEGLATYVFPSNQTMYIMYYFLMTTNGFSYGESTEIIKSFADYHGFAPPKSDPIGSAIWNRKNLQWTISEGVKDNVSNDLVQYFATKISKGDNFYLPDFYIYDRKRKVKKAKYDSVADLVTKTLENNFQAYGFESSDEALEWARHNKREVSLAYYTTGNGKESRYLMLTGLGFSEVPFKLIDEFLVRQKEIPMFTADKTFAYVYLNENNISDISKLIEYLKDKTKRLQINLSDNPIKTLPDNFLDLDPIHTLDLTPGNFEDPVLRDVPGYELRTFIKHRENKGINKREKDRLVKKFIDTHPIHIEGNNIYIRDIVSYLNKGLDYREHKPLMINIRQPRALNTYVTGYATNPWRIYNRSGQSPYEYQEIIELGHAIRDEIESIAKEKGVSKSDPIIYNDDLVTIYEGHRINDRYVFRVTYGSGGPPERFEVIPIDISTIPPHTSYTLHKDNIFEGFSFNTNPPKWQEMMVNQGSFWEDMKKAMYEDFAKHNPDDVRDNKERREEAAESIRLPKIREALNESISEKEKQFVVGRFIKDHPLEYKDDGDLYFIKTKHRHNLSVGEYKLYIAYWNNEWREYIRQYITRNMGKDAYNQYELFEISQAIQEEYWKKILKSEKGTGFLVSNLTNSEYDRYKELKDLMGEEEPLNEDTERLENTKDKTQTKKITISFDISDVSPQIASLGKITQDITLAMSPTSVGLFELGEDIEKFSGLSKKDASEYKETPTDAYVYGLVQTMNGGKDIFFWTNGTRLAGATKEVGVWPAILEQISHEGLHLTRAILAKHIMGDGFPTEEWPSMGEQENDSIEEEAMTSALGMVVEQITDAFLDMAMVYIYKSKKEDLNEGMSKKEESFVANKFIEDHPLQEEYDTEFGREEYFIHELKEVHGSFPSIKHYVAYWAHEWRAYVYLYIETKVGKGIYTEKEMHRISDVIYVDYITQINPKYLNESIMDDVPLEQFKKDNPEVVEILSRFPELLQRELAVERKNPEEFVEDFKDYYLNSPRPIEINLEDELNKYHTIDTLTRVPQDVIDVINNKWGTDFKSVKVYDPNPDRYFEYAKFSPDTAKPSLMVNGEILYGVGRFIAALIRGDKTMWVWDIKCDSCEEKKPLNESVSDKEISFIADKFIKWVGATPNYDSTWGTYILYGKEIRGPLYSKPDADGNRELLQPDFEMFWEGVMIKYNVDPTSLFNYVSAYIHMILQIHDSYSDDDLKQIFHKVWDWLKSKQDPNRLDRYDRDVKWVSALEESEEKWLPSWEETQEQKEKVLPKIKKIVKLLLKNTKIHGGWRDDRAILSNFTTQPIAGKKDHISYQSSGQPYGWNVMTGRFFGLDQLESFWLWTLYSGAIQEIAKRQEKEKGGQINESFKKDWQIYQLVQNRQAIPESLLRHNKNLDEGLSKEQKDSVDLSDREIDKLTDTFLRAHPLRTVTSGHQQQTMVVDWFVVFFDSMPDSMGDPRKVRVARVDTLKYNEAVTPRDRNSVAGYIGSYIYNTFQGSYTIPEMYVAGEKIYDKIIDIIKDKWLKPHGEGGTGMDFKKYKEISNSSDQIDEAIDYYSAKDYFKKPDYKILPDKERDLLVRLFMKDHPKEVLMDNERTKSYVIQKKDEVGISSGPMSVGYLNRFNNEVYAGDRILPQYVEQYLYRGKVGNSYRYDEYEYVGNEVMRLYAKQIMDDNEDAKRPNTLDNWDLSESIRETLSEYKEGWENESFSGSENIKESIEDVEWDKIYKDMMVISEKEKEKISNRFISEHPINRYYENVELAGFYYKATEGAMAGTHIIVKFDETPKEYGVYDELLPGEGEVQLYKTIRDNLFWSVRNWTNKKFGKETYDQREIFLIMDSIYNKYMKQIEGWESDNVNEGRQSGLGLHGSDYYRDHPESSRPYDENNLNKYNMSDKEMIIMNKFLKMIKPFLGKPHYDYQTAQTHKEYLIPFTRPESLKAMLFEGKWAYTREPRYFHMNDAHANQDVVDAITEWISDMSGILQHKMMDFTYHHMNKISEQAIDSIVLPTNIE